MEMCVMRVMNPTCRIAGGSHIIEIESCFESLGAKRTRAHFISTGHNSGLSAT